MGSHLDIDNSLQNILDQYDSNYNLTVKFNIKPNKWMETDEKQLIFLSKVLFVNIVKLYFKGYLLVVFRSFYEIKNVKKKNPPTTQNSSFLGHLTAHRNTPLYLSLVRPKISQTLKKSRMRIQY